MNSFFFLFFFLFFFYTNLWWISCRGDSCHWQQPLQDSFARRNKYGTSWCVYVCDFILLSFLVFSAHFCAAVFAPPDHLSSSLFSGDGATWQGHVSQSISTLSSTGISICCSALPSRLEVVGLQETRAHACMCACVCVYVRDMWSEAELAFILSSTCQHQSHRHGEAPQNIAT